ncbi:MAG: polynucleotide kinase-phosphatase [Aquisalinus sp.]|nr:polynucleotide kinase-phosphatase [Aquisalinus sp.]
MTDRISIPEYCLVLLIGPSGSGKSSFARKYFKDTEIVSSDDCRAMVCDDDSSLEATSDAFELVHYIAEKRLKARRLTVIDATNVKPEDRRQYVTLAKKYHALVAAFVFFTDEKICHERNLNRPNRDFGPHVVRNHIRSLKRGFKGIQRKEGIKFVHTFDTPEEVDALKTIERSPLWPDKREETGPFDIIGDIHGCAGEAEALLEKLGYTVEFDGEPGLRSYNVTPPKGRRALFLGDLVDRGPRSPDVLRLVKSMIESESALCIMGNHENKLLRKLNGRNVQLTHGLADTVEQFEQQPDGFADEMQKFIDGLISHYVFDNGKLVIAHAGLREDMQNRSSGKVRSFAMYGDTTGEIDDFGLPVRADWAAEYRGRAKVVYGHTPVPEAEWVNGTICIDTGCVFGGKLTALRYPELELVDVPAEKTYYEPVKPLVKEITDQSRDPMAIRLSDVQGKRVVETKHGGRVTINEAHAAGALETMSRFAVDPRWLIYLPPTMSPSETSKEDGWLERPEEAFAYYRGQGVERAICEEKHMGSRAVIVVCKDEVAAKKRFGAHAGSGVIYTRTGRPFFGIEMQEQVLQRVRNALSRAGYWDEFATDWFCLDAEIMPWSAKAQILLERQYAPVAASAKLGLGTAAEALKQANQRGVDVKNLLDATEKRLSKVEEYTDAYRHYIWPVNSIEDLRIAPFHLMAAEGQTFLDQPHPWHMEKLAKLSFDDDPVMMATAWRIVDLGDELAVKDAIAWWEDLTFRGGEGMVVKPEQFVVRCKKGLVQPAVKCRGKEYLRLIYGPDYDTSGHLERLRQRGLGRKRSMAVREFALGAEALQRFVDHQPLARTHEAVFGVLALELEPVDPRL